MSTTGRPAATQQEGKEMDSVKESISDIINQLQDIDPARLSFSPFLDLDTQISLAPVSDSPESSMEELRSSSHSVTGSQHSLEVLPETDQNKSSESCHQKPDDSLPDEPRTNEPEQGVLDKALSSGIATTRALEDDVEKRVHTHSPASGAGIPNGTDTPKRSSGPIHQDSPANEGSPLIDRAPESVELGVWSSDQPGPGVGDTDAEAPGAGRQCCCQCSCCRSGRVPALCSVLASLLGAAGILGALYFYVPVEIPHCPDLAGRLVFTLCCCLVAALPIILAMLLGSVCQFCTGSLDPVQPISRRRALQRLFVSSSLEQLFLYVLNLLLMASQLPQDQLKVVPMVVAVFIVGRLIYWISLHVCSSWRGFGSGLTVFPLVAMVALNLFYLYKLGLKHPLFGSQDGQNQHLFFTDGNVTEPGWRF